MSEVQNIRHIGMRRAHALPMGMVESGMFGPLKLD